MTSPAETRDVLLAESSDVCFGAITDRPACTNTTAPRVAGDPETDFETPAP